MDLYAEKANGIAHKKVGTINGGQDGAIWNGYLFRLDTKGFCTVTELASFRKAAEFRLDRSEVVVPHSIRFVSAMNPFATATIFLCCMQTYTTITKIAKIEKKERAAYIAFSKTEMRFPVSWSG